MARAMFSNAIGFDDGPFARSHRGDVRVFGVVYSGPRLDGVLSGCVRRDGANAARKLTELALTSKFAPQVQLVMLQGIALGGFNVVDLQELHENLQVPVLVVARRKPNLAAIREALLSRVPGGKRKWKLIESFGEMEPVAGVFVQRVGLSLKEAGTVIQRFAVHSRIPEPLRVAHLIAGGATTGQSRGRP